MEIIKEIRINGEQFVETMQWLFVAVHKTNDQEKADGYFLKAISLAKTQKEKRHHQTKIIFNI